MFNPVIYNVNFLLSDFLLSTSKSLHSCFSKLLVGKKVTRKYVRKYFLRYLLIQKCIGNHKNQVALLGYTACRALTILFWKSFYKSFTYSNNLLGLLPIFYSNFKKFLQSTYFSISWPFSISFKIFALDRCLIVGPLSIILINNHQSHLRNANYQHIWSNKHPDQEETRESSLSNTC